MTKRAYVDIRLDYLAKILPALEKYGFQIVGLVDFGTFERNSGLSVTGLSSHNREPVRLIVEGDVLPAQCELPMTPLVTVILQQKDATEAPYVIDVSVVELQPYRRAMGG